MTLCCTCSNFLRHCEKGSYRACRRQRSTNAQTYLADVIISGGAPIAGTVVRTFDFEGWDFLHLRARLFRYMMAMTAPITTAAPNTIAVAIRPFSAEVGPGGGSWSTWCREPGGTLAVGVGVIEDVVVGVVVGMLPVIVNGKEE